MYGQSESQSSEKSFAFVIAGCAAVLISIGFVLLARGPNKQTGDVHFVSKINPNKASVASLVRLPGVGPVRAKDIVAYRQRITNSSGNVAFQEPNDLQNVKGIGPKTVEKIEMWLKFDQKP